MARACLQLALVLVTIQAVSAESNFMYKMVKSMGCSSFKIPFICSGSDTDSGGSGSGGGSSGSGSSSACSGDSCCAGSSCYSLPGMGCSSSRGACSCVGSSFTTAGQCQCKQGASCGEGTCSGGSSSGGSGFMSDLFEENNQVVRVPGEDHSRAVALYTGGAFLLMIAGLSAGVRKLRRRGPGSAEGVGELELEPRWDLLSQVSSSGE